MELEFELYLIAIEFGIRVEEVKKWPLWRVHRHLIALKKYYEMQTGTMEEMASRPKLEAFHFMEID